ncbi:uncharacterized protein LOC120359728 isoform X1 [Solenopsis invicta]|uniref:uncharacterized protein LOC120359728 isoform X1 n=1 Tax=Solenopsis invicta TaxID=13686 RepID=UPI00193D7C3B|nr:uncharacterized protein LOC120359728 isoform X1 [Solenopsis invicta]
MMIISIIVILLLTGGVFSSLPVQGSISMIHDDTISIDLRASESNVDLGVFIEGLRAIKKPRIHLIIDLGKEVIEIDGETNLEQDYSKVGSYVQDILRRITSLMQEHNDHEILIQNTIKHKILHAIMPQENQDTTDLDKDYFVSSWILSNSEFVLEIEKLILRNELSLEYIKSVQNVLLWLIKLFDTKWHQLHVDLDYISRWRLLNLQKQIEFLLKSLIVNNQQHEKPNDYKYILEDGSDDISSIENVKVEEVILTEKEKGKVSLIPKFNISIDDNFSINNAFFSKLETLQNEDLIKNETSSKSKKITSSFHDKHKKHHGKVFDQTKNVLPSENITNTLQKTDQPKSIETGATSHGSSKNVMDIRKTPFQRILQVLDLSNKDNEQKHKGKQRENNERMEIKSNSASAMDEILEAVDDVLPRDMSVEIL